MTATMNDMNWFIIDTILVDTLQVGDYIEVENTIVQITAIDDDETGTWLSWRDDYDNEYEDCWGSMEMINIYMELDRD